MAYVSGSSTARARRLHVGRILMLHGVDDRSYPATALEALLGYLRRAFTIVPLATLVEHVIDLAPSLDDLGPVAITFDDGLRNNVTVAYPILRRWRVPATFFVCPGLIESRRWQWTHEVAARLGSLSPGQLAELARYLQAPVASADGLKEWLKALPAERRAAIVECVRALTPSFVPTEEQRRRFDPMTWDDLASLDPELISVGSHTVSHPILSTLTPDQAGHEIRGSRRWLEAKLRRPVDHFCYPNGTYDGEVLRAVRATYRAAVTATPGFVRTDDDVHRLRRISVAPNLPLCAWRLHRPTA